MVGFFIGSGTWFATQADHRTLVWGRDWSGYLLGVVIVVLAVVRQPKAGPSTLQAPPVPPVE